MQDLVQLGGELLVDLADPRLDVGLDVLGDDLARLDGMVQELAEVILGPLLLDVALRPGRRDHLVQQVGGFDGLPGGAAAWACSFRCS